MSARSYAGIALRGAAMGAGGGAADGGGWQQTREQQRRRRRQELRDKSVFGKREGTNLKSGAKYCDLFVFKVHNDVTLDELESWIKGENIGVESLKQVSHAESVMKSFHLKIEIKDKDKVMSEDFWPNGIGCRDFINFSRSINRGGRLK